MIIENDNTDMLKTVAEGLGDFLVSAAFVGGSVLHLYADNPAAAIPRASDDVDIVVQIVSSGRFAEFEEKLRQRGFANDMNGPLCRMIYKGVKVDVLSTAESAAGFANKWYESGYNNSHFEDIGGITIRIFDAVYYIATKFVAYNDRGSRNMLASQDFEDIIYVFDTRSTFEKELNESELIVRNYLKEQIGLILGNPALREAVNGHLGFGQTAQRADRIMEIFTRFCSHN